MAAERNWFLDPSDILACTAFNRRLAGCRVSKSRSAFSIPACQLVDFELRPNDQLVPFDRETL
ncbi:MAG: hypothetical protein DLM68_19510 [Hyphomicrobiales bacterium]|nr:MAG: hypothetical protein DLM68_19510 [Hyphomicrobiales bacterium]